jgi:hypothetical protein
MATLQSGTSVGTRLAAGDSVMAAAKSVSVKAIAKRFDAFKKIHAAYGAADARVKKASEALAKQQALVGEADVEQDAAVLELAQKLSGDGMPRLNPFKPFGAPSPAALCVLGYGDEATEVLALEKAVLKKKGLSHPSIAAAKKMGLTAKKVQKELASIPKLQQARAAAMSGREALEQAWETAFAGLKRAARAAEDDGARGLYAALFERAPKAKATAPKAKPVAAPAAAPP